MSKDPWNLFPYPTHDGSKAVDGSLWDSHEQCKKCLHRWCLSDDSAAVGELKSCRHGIAYAKIDDSRVMIGMVSTEAENRSPATRKRLKKEPERRVTPAQVQKSVDSARKIGPGVIDDFNLKQKAVIEEAKHDPALQKIVADSFHKEYENTLNQSHDFMQLINLVRSNAEALLHEKFPSLSPEEAAEQTKEIGAIYFSTKLMQMKTDALLYLHEINRVHGQSSKFEVHPFLLKYVRIYDWQAKQKDLKIRVQGSCRSSVVYNSHALGSIFQAFLDNMVKYSPAGSRASIVFAEYSDEVTIDFVSLGPQIISAEKNQIFMPKYRSAAARQTELEGQGIGLAVAKQVADALGISIRVEQDQFEHEQYRSRFETTFSITLRVA